MDKKDKKRFAQLLVAISELFEKNLSTPVLNIYFKALEKFSIQQVENALQKVVVSCKFFPKPVEIIELIGEGPGLLEDIAQVQADTVVNAIRRIGAYQTVRFNDPVTTAVIQNCFGGWIMMCAELVEEKELWLRKDFVKYYQSYSRQNIRSPDKLIGIIEADNIVRGFINHIPKPIQVAGVEVLSIEYKN